MRKFFFYASIALVASVLMLTGCQKEIDAPEEQQNNVTAAIDPNEETLPGIPFEIIASTATDTKTEMSAGNPVWVANDKLNVFYAPTSTTDYSTNCEFTITSENLASKTFSGDLPGSYNDSASYDWYALYPYSASLSTPTGSGHYFGIGSSGKSVNQVQTGNSSMSHLAGEYFPLFGKATAVTGTTIPTLLMKQALAVVKVHVTNACPEGLTVTSVGFTGTENIIGTYYINFTGEEPVFTKSGDSYVSSTASLTVSSGSAISNGESADFYLAIKPFTAAKDSDITVTVNGLSKKITMAKDVSFNRGKIKTVNFNYKDVVDLPWESAEEGEGVGKAALSAVEGVTLSADSDYATGPYYIKFNSNSHYITVKTDSEIGALSMAVKANSAGSGSSKSTLTVSESSNGSSWTEVEVFEVPDAGETDVFTTSTDFKSSSRYVKISFTKALNNAGIGRIAISRPSTDPKIVADAIEVDALGGTDLYADYEVRNFEDDVTVSAYTGCITAATIDGGRIKYTASANYGTGSTVGTITLQSASSAASDKVVSVTQTGNTLSQTGASGSPLVLTIPAAFSTATIDLTSTVFGWNAAVTPATGKNLTIQTGPSTFVDSTSGTKDDDPQTITVSSTESAPASGDPLTLGTLELYRNGNTSDSQKITVTIKKAVSGTPLTQDYTVVWEASSGALGSTIASVGGTDTGTINTAAAGGTPTYEWDYTRTLVSLASNKSDYISWESPVLHVGSGNALESLVFSTSNIPGTVKSISVVCYGDKHKISATVDGKDYIAETNMTNSSATYTNAVEGTGSGAITISILPQGITKKAFYIQSITVVFNN